jgi:galactose mutarotase-like enzyme
LRGVDGDVSDVREAACFPLVPFNRIRGGAFTCDGRTVRLAPNIMASDPSPLHGMFPYSMMECIQQSRMRAV